MWHGSWLLPPTDDPRPEVGSLAFLHVPAGVLLVTVDDVVIDENGMRVDISGEGEGPGLTLCGLEYQADREP